MRRITFFVVLIIFFSCQKNEPGGFYFPPEWAPHAAVWVDFTSEQMSVDDFPARINIIYALHNYVPVKVMVDNEDMIRIARQWLNDIGADITRISFHQHPIPNSWIRDAGPIFLSNGQVLKLADFKWNCYGRPDWCEDPMFARRGEVDNDLANEMGIDIKSVDVFAEGGGLEVSNTVVMAYAEMADQRNSGKSRDEVEKIILELYGKEKMIWLEDAPVLDKNGRKIYNYFGQGANGHVDAMHRFLNDSTIFVTVIPENEKNNSPVQRADYDNLRSNVLQLQSAKNVNGKPFNIIEFPLPDISLYEYPVEMNQSMLDQPDFENYSVGDTVVFVPVVGYANFLITNGAVIVSQYWREGLPQSEKDKDEYVLKMLGRFYPDRDIIGMEALPINWNGGGIHCRTQQEPELVQGATKRME